MAPTAAAAAASVVSSAGTTTTTTTTAAASNIPHATASSSTHANSTMPSAAAAAAAPPQQQQQPPPQQTSSHHQAQQQPSQPSQPSQASQQQPSRNAAAASKGARQGGGGGGNGSSRAQYSVPAFVAPLVDPRCFSSRSRYKTFILSNGVFEVEQRFDVREVIGQGAYGIVSSALDLKSNALVALKKVENVFDHRSLAKRTLRELKFCRFFQHENVLSLERVMRPYTSTYSDIYLVSELMETDLACVIRSPQELTDEHCQFFIYQVLRGLKYIHSANVIHRDLKPRNLLVNSNCDLKICDFGLARFDDPANRDRFNMSSYVATRWYRAPEVILERKRYTKAVDMWSVGCILAELIGRKPLFPGRDSFHQITLIVSILGTPPPPNPAEQTSKSSRSTSGPTEDYIMNLPKRPKVPFRSVYPMASPLACDLLDRLLVFDPEKRLTVEEALRHPYIQDLHCEEDEPVCETFVPEEFDYEYARTTKEDLRALITREIMDHYPDDPFELNRSPLDTFSSMMLRNLPNKGRKIRRRSI